MRLLAGKGPLMSPMYKADHVRVIVRFLVVATVVNFVLMTLTNAL
jgi:hypothetical protein